jgi:hypothetical protein
MAKKQSDQGALSMKIGHMTHFYRSYGAVDLEPNPSLILYSI